MFVVGGAKNVGSEAVETQTADSGMKVAKELLYAFGVVGDW
jgi:hypothetical protein